MSEKFVCPICGEPTRVYMGNARKDRLCGKHADMLKNGELIVDEKGNFINPNEEKTKTSISDNELTCIICDKVSNGKHFCLSCYKQFSKKVLYLKVLKCKDFEKLEAEYESELVCEDGHLVKSTYEKLIDNWFYQENIPHAYEKKLDIDKDRNITPDFYIPEYNGIKNIYIEFWGYDETNIKYQQRKEYKQKIYSELVKRDRITVIYLTKKEVEKDMYKQKIKYAEQGKINE